MVDAYLSPILRRYVDQVAAEMPGVRLFFMQSSGGLTDAHAFQGKDAILSGPAGGIVGMVRTARSACATARDKAIRVIGFDMGGTSTDVSHYAGEFERAFETQVAGVRMRAPMMSIHTVAAGGGSILGFDGARLRVGPGERRRQSGPGVLPARRAAGRDRCQRDARQDPAGLLSGGVRPGRRRAARPRRSSVARFTELAAEIARATGSERSPEAVAEGFIDIAVGAMANAIKKISVARGYDVTRYTLQCFGGAGGQHACRVADALGMNRVFVHPLAGVLSAYGMGLADQSVMREAAVELPLAAALDAAGATVDALARDAEGELLRQGVGRERLRVHRRVHVRYEGTDSALVVPFGSADEIRAAFEVAYRQRFAFLMPERGLIVEAVSVEAVGQGDAPSEPVVALQPAQAGAGRGDRAALERRALVGRRPRRPRERAARPRDRRPGDHRRAQRDDGRRARLAGARHRARPPADRARRAARTRRAIGTTVDPVMLEVFNNLFMNIAEQMGLQLQNTAYSVNIKERLDFSCALFDADGNLIANAPHMPVHLGSMSESIKTVIARNAGRMQPGDVYVLNDPYHGGTHLPDVTVVTPVYLDERCRAALPFGERWWASDSRRPRPTFYVGSRGHHADIGGITPGSMPPFSTRIDEEGVLIDNVKLVDGGRLREAEMLALLRSGAHPSRNPEQNLADLQAQIAANEKGVQELRKMVAQFGLDVVQAYMRHVQDNAEESVRRVITQLSDGASRSRSTTARRSASRSASMPRRARAEIDFTGTSAAARQQLQRADGGLHGRGAVRVPHPGRRRHPAERRLPEAAEGDHPRRLDAEPASAGLGGRRQRRDLDLHHQRAVRRARRDGRRASAR